MRRVFSCVLVATIVINSMNQLVVSAFNEESNTSQFIESSINQEGSSEITEDNLKEESYKKTQNKIMMQQK